MKTLVIGGKRIIARGLSWRATWSPHRLWLRVGLGAKMGVLVVVGTLSLIALFAYLGSAALSENTQRNLQERVVLAQMTASYVDAVLENVRNALTDAAADEGWAHSELAEATLERSYRRLDSFAQQAFLVDRGGHVMATWPAGPLPADLSAVAPVTAALEGQPFAVSRHVEALGPSGSYIVVAAPIRDSSGSITRALAFALNITNPSVRAFSHPVGLGQTGYMDLIALDGRILASTRPERVGNESDHGDTLVGMIRDHRQAVSACHDCHSSPAQAVPRDEVLAFAPLDQAQWGVTVRQSEEEVFATTRLLQVRIFALLMVSVVGALVLVYLTSRSVIRPVQALTTATQRIARGDLSTPIEAHGHDEIGTLARSFDKMRAQLSGSMAEIQALNRDLDVRVQERTQQLQQALEENARLYAELQRKEQMRGELLHRVISVQEEERRRISRELHDETCQILSGLSYALDNAAELNASPEIQQSLERMHELTDAALDGIDRIILDLRPSVLDHLGLIPALRAYAETRLTGLGIRFSIREIGDARRLPSTIETTLFRVAQEAVNNIARHSGAAHALFVFEFADDAVEARIVDDGKGFDPSKVANASDEARGLGLMSMEERMGTLGGTFRIRSVPGSGTVIQLRVPLEGGTDGKDSSTPGR